MRVPSRSALVLLVLAISGCAGIKSPKAKTENVEIDSAQRKEEAVRDFEQQREYAQFQAALSRWRQGDTDGCRRTLEQLLERKPGHVEGGLLLAELLLLADEPAAAMAQVEKTLTEHPDDARLQHTMGLLLEAQGRTAEAVPYFQQAVAIDPQSEVFSLSLETAIGATRR